MLPKKHWPLLLFTLLLLGGTDPSPTGSNLRPPARKKVSIVDGANSMYKKTGDTLWLTGINERDTLAFSFNGPPNNGYTWFITDLRGLDSISYKATHPVSTPGENSSRGDHFEFIVTQKHTFFIRLVYRRPFSDVIRKVCIAQPL